MSVYCMTLKKLERYLRINLLGPGPRLIKKNLPGRGLTNVEKQWIRRWRTYTGLIASPRAASGGTEELWFDSQKGKCSDRL